MAKKVMNNETEFIFDEVLETGFTTIYNEILMDTRLSDSAIGLYCRIIRFRNIPNWIVNQSTLAHENNKRSKIESAMKELVANDYIEKIQLRNSKGHMDGVKYIIYSKSKTFRNVENTEVQPNAEKPKSDKPKSDKPKSGKLQQEIQDSKNKDIKNKDIYSNTSSKGEKHPLIIRFEEQIGKTLGKYNLSRFNSFIEKYELDFLTALVEYAEETEVHAFNWLPQRIDDYLKAGIETGEGVRNQIASFHEQNRKDKNNAIREKEERKQMDDAIDNAIDREVDGLAPVIHDVEGAEDINSLKELIKPHMTEVSFNTWIGSVDFFEKDDKIIGVCPNEFTIGIIERRYSDMIYKVLKLNGLEKRLVFTLEKN